MDFEGPVLLDYGTPIEFIGYTAQSDYSSYKALMMDSETTHIGGHVPSAASSLVPGASSAHLCQVCGAKSHGAHFQVQTCRACAAFFRRTCAGGRSYKCRRATKNCDVSKNAAFNCRYCRFEKCRKVGMKYHGFEEIPSDVSPQEVVRPRMECPDIQSEPCSVASSDFSNSGVQFSKNQIMCDTTELLVYIGSILEGDLVQHSPAINSAFRLTTMQRMILSYESIFNSDIINVVETPSVNLEFTNQALSAAYVKHARFLMSSPHFTKLNIQDRWAIYRRATTIFLPVDTCAPTIKLFGKDVTDRRMYFNLNKAVNVDTYYYDGEKVPEELKDQVTRIFKPLSQHALDLIINPMRELNLTDFELVYLQVLLIWNIRSMQNVTDAAKEIAEGVVEEISNELHNYYMFEMMMTNYASRLVRINSIRSEVEAFSNKIKENLTMAQIFNMFECPLLGDKLIR
ncbi:hypothetical protein L596_011893 [Steinernema carpocapsae]|uniref:Nuclear receptor domain-containing protein n=1 Tax=Steinernema carpocapsae TaxID=34508 RepID=A0A4U5NW95_STECR|nr:hypothetical protein L596_011893 [Steinernema carpocapsae]